MKKYNKYGAAEKNPQTIVIEFPQPKIIAISEVMENINKVEELIITLNLPVWGDYMVKISKVGSTFNWYDPSAPIKTRSFPDIESLMWEYELPKQLVPYLEKL
jgi:hypothetical protein